MTAPTPHESLAAGFRIVDLFAGPGGLDVAARYLGVPLEAGIEWDKDACETRKAAGFDSESTTPRDVRAFGPDQFPKANVLTGGPPCQTYTVAGSGSGRRALDKVLKLAEAMAKGEDTSALIEELDAGDKLQRTALVMEPLRWALDAWTANRPYEAIVLEQVQAVLPVWEVVRHVLIGKGYSVEPPKVLYTEEFGVPQTRRRAILIARWEAKAVMPQHTHQRYRKGVDPEKDHPYLPWVSMGDVLGRPKPFEVVSNYGTGGDPKARGRRTSDLPAATVTGKVSRNRVLGPGATESRFTNAEAGQLQTFPADYPWRGKDIPQQIGNAIPPRMGIHVLAAALGLGDEARDRALAALDADAITA